MKARVQRLALRKGLKVIRIWPVSVSAAHFARIIKINYTVKTIIAEIVCNHVHFYRTHMRAADFHQTPLARLLCSRAHFSLLTYVTQRRPCSQAIAVMSILILHIVLARIH